MDHKFSLIIPFAGITNGKEKMSKTETYRGEDVLRERVRTIANTYSKSAGLSYGLSYSACWNLACADLAESLHMDGLHTSSVSVDAMKLKR